MTDIVFTSEKHIGLVTLNRASALNALTFSMIQALQHQLQLWQEDENIHAVVVQSACEKAFCAGGDVRWLYEKGREHDPQQLEFFWHEYRLNHFIAHYKKPYIALMDGITMGGGVGISLHGSHPIASERFSFAMPETTIGFFPDIGASYLLSRCPGATGIYLGLTGNRINEVDARTLGLVKQIVASKDFPQLLNSLIKTDLSTDAHARVDQCIQHYAMPMSAAPISELYDEINKCFHFIELNKIMKALEKSDEWHNKTRFSLLQKSPLSLHITLKQLHNARKMDVDHCLKQDYCLVNHFIKDLDFYEGVRALLIDKDKAPKWQHDSFVTVQENDIRHYFKSKTDDLKFIKLPSAISV